MATVSRRHWFSLGARVARLALTSNDRTPELVRDSYDRIAPGYDDAWTTHMRSLSVAMLDRLAVPPGAACLDLTCGTGFVTGELARRSGGRVTGVDASAGMLGEARRRHGDSCTFIQSDAVQYLRSCRRSSLDVVTCAWGLGYTRPLAVVREAARVLRPGGRLGIIDNTLFSLAGVLWASILAFAEQPEALVHVMRVRFLPDSRTLSAIARLCGLAVLASHDGSKTYHVPDGQAAIARLTATGAAAGFEFAADQASRDAIYGRFAEIMAGRHPAPEGIPITHRYLAVIGEKR